MRLVILKMIGSEEINGIFRLKWRQYGPNGDILDYWGTQFFNFYPNISHQRLEVYRFETIDIIIFFWNNDVSENTTPVSTTVIIERVIYLVGVIQFLQFRVFDTYLTPH